MKKGGQSGNEKSCSTWKLSKKVCYILLVWYILESGRTDRRLTITDDH